ncbi:WD40/YVTN/BNR-like repeat-containing protein [Micromonospora sp. SL4-19]|uniref:WD40/YVTN/BNR-like repeat-containing protein n=1 Tax=Micromonospora sp. SL4-19 TaxID=3399129 RepID=UPI003A4DE331
MSDREFTGFEVDTVADAVRQPPLDDLWTAAYARRRRRAGGVALALVIAFASMAALPLAARTRGVEWAGPDQPRVRQDRGGQLFITGPESGVLVQQRDDACGLLLFTHTEDGGRNWTDFDAARYDSTRCGKDAEGNPFASADFTVLGQRSYLVRDGDRLRLSTDYGRTWRDAERSMVAVVAFPEKAQPVFCQRNCGALREPVAVDPSTGTVYRLNGRAPVPYPPSSIYPAADGTIWVTYWPGEPNVMVVARSTDRGATWDTWRPAAGTDVIAVTGVSDREAYLLIASPPVPGVQPMRAEGTSQLLRTTDGGRTWADVDTDLPASLEDRSLVVGSDGSLLLAESGHMQMTSSMSKTLVSRDAGRHFTTALEYDRLDGSAGGAPGYVWLYGRDDMTVLGADHVQLTTDGKDWTRFRLPD